MNELLNNITTIGVAQTFLLISLGMLVIGMIIYVYQDSQRRKEK